MQKLNTASVVLIFIYIAALHTSMALMEICGWLLMALALAQMAALRRMPRFPLWLPALGLLVSVFIGVWINPPGRGMLLQVGFLRWIALLYFYAWLLRENWSEVFERRLIKVWTVMLLVSAVYALFQTFTGIDLIRPAAHVVSDQGGVWRPTGFFSRSLAFAYSFGFSFLALWFARVQLPPRAWAWILGVSGTLTVIATDSRGAWIGFAAAIFFYLAVARRRQLPVFLLLLAVVTFATLQTKTGLAEKLNRMVTLTYDIATYERTHVWQGYFAMWREHPFFGVGLLQGDLILPDYYAKLGIHEEFVSNAHNVYLQWLAGSGVFGLFFYLWFCVYFLRLAWRLRRTTSWGWSILLAQIYLHVGALSENNFLTAITNHTVVFCWAVLLALDPAPPAAAPTTNASTFKKAAPP